MKELKISVLTIMMDVRRFKYLFKGETQKYVCLVASIWLCGFSKAHLKQTQKG